MESNPLKYRSFQMVHLIQFKFDVYVIGHRPTYCVNFGKFKNNSFFTGVQKRILIHYNHGVKL